jgi:hypothetical protein
VGNGRVTASLVRLISLHKFDCMELSVYYEELRKGLRIIRG